MEQLEAIRKYATISVEEAGQLFGLGRSAAYEQARLYIETNAMEGLPVLRFGRLLRCPVPALVRTPRNGGASRLMQGQGSERRKVLTCCSALRVGTSSKEGGDDRLCPRGLPAMISLKSFG